MPGFALLSRHRLAAACWLTLAAHAPALLAQSAPDEASAPAGRGLSITPRLSLGETWTDNLTLAPDGSRDRALITTVSPGITIASRSGLLRGVLDYTLDGIVYTKSDQKNRLQNQLNARGTAELVPQALFVDATGTISQQSISAFGAQAPDNRLDNANRTEMRTLTVSPYWRSSLAGLVSVDLRANATMRDSSETEDSSGDSKEGSLTLSLAGPVGRQLSWGLQAMTRRIHYEQGGLDNRNSTVMGSLTWRPDIDWQFGVTGGRERSDFLGKDTSSIYGLNARWTPTPRTQVSADWQHHSYGDSHNVLVEHRMQRFVLRGMSTQSVSTSSAPAGQLTNYQLLDLQYGAFESDPVRRDALVRALLASLGLSPDAITSTGFLANSATQQRRNEVSMTWSGLRLTAMLSLSDTATRSLGEADTTSTDLGLTSNIRQRGATMTLSYRLTANANATVTLTTMRNRGESGSGLGSDMTSLYASTSIRLGPRTDGTVGVRHTRSDDTLSGYRENAVYASVTQRF